MAIVMYLGRNVKEYNGNAEKKERGESAEEKIKRYIEEGRIRCDICTQSMKKHSKYPRGIKETGEELEIIVVYCNVCNKWHALLPDFLLSHKQYSVNEIERVIIDSATASALEIDTEASESTVKRWISQIGERLKMAVGVLKYLFMQMGSAISETLIEAGHIYNELEQVLDMAPEDAKHSNRIGLANIWLGKHNRRELIC